MKTSYTITLKQPFPCSKCSWIYNLGFELTTLVVIRTDCLGSCKSNDHHNDYPFITLSSIDKALAVVNGMALARTLGDMPSNICTPTYLAQTAQAPIFS
jgi:hypothetical protein